MRDSFEKDTEGLLVNDSSRSSGSSAEEPWKTELSAQKLSLRSKRFLLVPVIILCLTNIVTFAALVLSISSPRTQRSSCPTPNNHPPTGVAPTLAHLVSDPKPELFNVTFFRHDNPFRQRDSLETDLLWEYYTQSGDDAGFIMIPRGEEAAADIDPSRHAYVDRPDLGMVGYPVLPEAIHETHCVDKLRQNLYYNVAHKLGNCEHNQCVPPSLEEWDVLHIDHCVEILRRRVACTADLGIVPFMWYQDSGKLTGDSIRMHTCNDYDALMEWVADHSAVQPPLDAPNRLVPPEGQYRKQHYD